MTAHEVATIVREVLRAELEARPSQPPRARLLDYAQAAALLNMKRGTLACLVSRKQIPCIRLAKRVVRFDEAELIAWLDERRVPAELADQEDGL